MLDDLSREDRLRLMKFVCSFAWADLHVHAKERAFCEKLVRKLKLAGAEKDRVHEWLELPPPAEELDPTEIPRAHRALFLATAREMVMADGEIAEEEQENLTLLEQLLA
jgi:uncharacterized tellurite resistance protein B-like protein